MQNSLTQQKIIDWTKIKIKTDQKVKNPPSVKEGQVWWVNIGQNIGYEIFGKGKNFSRPVVIYKKLSRHNFLVVPTSTKIKIGSWFCDFVFQGLEMVAVLSQIKVIDYRRLENLLGDLSENDFNKVKDCFRDLYN